MNSRRCSNKMELRLALDKIIYSNYASQLARKDQAWFLWCQVNNERLVDDRGAKWCFCSRSWGQNYPNIADNISKRQTFAWSFFFVPFRHWFSFLAFVFACFISCHQWRQLSGRQSQTAAWTTPLLPCPTLSSVDYLSSTCLLLLPSGSQYSHLTWEERFS